jgi:hypothetical protein
VSTHQGQIDISKARVIESPVDAIEFGSGGALPAALSGARPARNARIPIEIRRFALICTLLFTPNPCHHDPRSSAAQGHRTPRFRVPQGIPRLKEP